MILHPDIARWIVLAEQQRLAELARRSHPRLAAARRHGQRRRRSDAEGA